MPEIGMPPNKDMFVVHDEERSLLLRTVTYNRRQQHSAWLWAAVICVGLVLSVWTFCAPPVVDLVGQEDRMTWEIPLLGSSKKEKELFTVPQPLRRCEWVVAAFKAHEGDAATNETEANQLLKYTAQSADVNVFYRATAHIFWKDYVLGGWGKGLQLVIADEENEINHHWLSESQRGGINMKSTWTWITGDQHLSNFGAWRNRGGDVVFSVNDFDEGAIYDFSLDILRIAVSVCNHAYTNKFSMKQINRILDIFTKSYIDTVSNYVGNEKALLFELTAKTTYGKLQKFLADVEEGRSTRKQLKKFTTTGPDGTRQFIKGDINLPDDNSRLAAVPPEIENDIREAITSSRYGATMMKLGWAVPQWDDDFFTVLDVAERVGSGIGSYGVNRYYVLLKGTDGLLTDNEGGAIILDVKYEPRGAVHHVLSPYDAAWYNIIFSNEAARVVEAQRRLTSYVDPFLGWIMLPDREINDTKPFYIRQRSPWKDGPDLANLLHHPGDFEDFVAQIAKSTATSHVRGSVAKAPGDFKSSIQLLLGNSIRNMPWRNAVRHLALAYRQQVLLDFECFHHYVKTNLTKKTYHH